MRARRALVEGHAPARVAEDGVVFGVWCGARRMVGFVTAEALAVLAGRALDEAQWLATYHAKARTIHRAVRAVAAWGDDGAERVVIAASAFAAP